MDTQTLRPQPCNAAHILVTGGNGYVGTLVVASLLQDTQARITCLIRPGHALGAVVAAVADEWQQQTGRMWSAAVEQRLAWMTLPADAADLPDLAPALAGIDEILHCAGCLDYQHEARLQAANVFFTAHLLLLARRLRLKRFVYLSSAYSSGFIDGPVPEGPLPEPPCDPTVYTRSKRHAERLVGASGVPFVVLRPSVLIGDSSSGRYTGKRYGLVQQWASLAELTCDRWQAEFHAVASDARLNLLHQDAFCAAFKAAHRWLPDGACANLVADTTTAPTLRQLWDLWFEVTQPARVHYHATLASVPLRRIAPRQRAYLNFARINLAIAGHSWQFDTGWLALLRARGLVMADATLDSVRLCQQRFVDGSAAMQRHAELQREQSAHQLQQAACLSQRVSVAR
jgi:nucleoside-diphosphate-sugar epimerase